MESRRATTKVSKLGLNSVWINYKETRWKVLLQRNTFSNLEAHHLFLSLCGQAAACKVNVDRRKLNHQPCHGELPHQMSCCRFTHFKVLNRPRTGKQTSLKTASLLVSYYKGADEASYNGTKMAADVVRFGSGTSLHSGRSSVGCPNTPSFQWHRLSKLFPVQFRTTNWTSYSLVQQ